MAFPAGTEPAFKVFEPLEGLHAPRHFKRCENQSSRGLPAILLV
jgi:hypothetical protein